MDGLKTNEEIAYKNLTTDGEKQFFSSIREYENKYGSYISRNFPKLNVNFYLIRYKNEGKSFEDYLRDTQPDMALLKSGISEIENNLKVKSSNPMKRYNERRNKERLEEKKRSRRKNIFFAILVISILFMMMYAFK